MAIRLSVAAGNVSGATAKERAGWESVAIDQQAAIKAIRGLFATSPSPDELFVYGISGDEVVMFCCDAGDLPLASLTPSESGWTCVFSVIGGKEIDSSAAAMNALAVHLSRLCKGNAASNFADEIVDRRNNTAAQAKRAGLR